ncbi:hypothetical protein OUZ56_000689 [Daphnia magna]|uniref:Uncharacterized protein n=1 Tax=Daphnia magna TaxID=35525 RepID=A0ABR0A139_9CRUS|nr:hypothetical protein OUZ56_000689 [Daphnia magna]
MESRSMKSEVNIMELAQSDIKARIKEGTKQEREAIDRLNFKYKYKKERRLFVYDHVYTRLSRQLLKGNILENSLVCFCRDSLTQEFVDDFVSSRMKSIKEMARKEDQGPSEIDSIEICVIIFEGKSPSRSYYMGIGYTFSFLGTV